MIIMLQYWDGDQDQALTLARLLADIEPKRREDAILVLARRGDCRESEEARRTEAYCSAKFSTMLLQSPRVEVGHPDGCWGLWAGAVNRLWMLHRQGLLPWGHSAVFTCETDGGPISPRWLDMLIKAHQRTLTQNLRVTGAVMDTPIPHVNGNLVLELGIIGDNPSLLSCPPGVAWDLHHAKVLIRETRACNVILNAYGTRDWSPGCLTPMARETAWVHGCKDSSVYGYARWAINNIWSRS
jgi:hypothetical protein